MFVSTVELQKVLFDLEHLTKPSCREDRVMKCNTSSVVRNCHIPQGEMDLSLKRELHGKPGGET
jgi:hypothetical protein